MKKVFLQAAALYSFSAAHAVVDEQMRLENLNQHCEQIKLELGVCQSLMNLYELQKEGYNRNEAFERVKEAVKTIDIAKLQQEAGQYHFEFIFVQTVLILRSLQDEACSGTSLEQIKKVIEEQFGPLKNIPNDNSEQAVMLQQVAQIVKQAVTRVANATAKNELPAVDASMFKKGIDAQAMRLKVINMIEGLLN